MKPAKLIEAYELGVTTLHRKNPSRGRAAAVAEFDRMLGDKGRQAVTEARHAVARKAAKKAQEAADLRRQISESLTAAQAPQPAPGARLAPPTGGAPEFGSYGAGMESPFWQQPSGAVPETQEPPRPLHEMDMDEFRAHAAGTLTAHGRAQGFGSPSWR